MKKIPDSIKKIFFTAVFSFFFLLGYSQDSASVAKNQPLSYFKIEIGIIVNCPVLPTCLQDKLIGLKGIKDFKKDQTSQSITFNIPEGVTTIEQVKSMALSCSFPASYVNILVDKKPFTK